MTKKSGSDEIFYRRIFFLPTKFSTNEISTDKVFENWKIDFKQWIITDSLTIITQPHLQIDPNHAKHGFLDFFSIETLRNKYRLSRRFCLNIITSLFASNWPTTEMRQLNKETSWNGCWNSFKRLPFEIIIIGMII